MTYDFTTTRLHEKTPCQSVISLQNDYNTKIFGDVIRQSNIHIRFCIGTSDVFKNDEKYLLVTVKVLILNTKYQF